MPFDWRFPHHAEIDGRPISFEDGIARTDDVEIRLQQASFGVDVSLSANDTPISHLKLFYEYPLKEDSLIFGDSFERGYADMEWAKPDAGRRMYWYFFDYSKKEGFLRSFGVMVHPHSIVSFRLKDGFLMVDFNLASGGDGVILSQRRLLCGTLINREGEPENLFASCRRFVASLMGDLPTRTTAGPVYGFNNWYYAYGVSSAEQILRDAKLLKELTSENPIRPYLVIDDGWSIHSCSGPWIPNEKFGDMRLLADQIVASGAKPGLWFRPLKDPDAENLPKHPLDQALLDPTSKEVILHIKEDVARFCAWGYSLLKYDFVTRDIFHGYGFNLPDELVEPGWHFQDRSRTNAEIAMDLYQAIREAAGESTLLLGCNAITHLIAGFVELNRIGDDTSGQEWARTRDYGVNALAFRLLQHRFFYQIDADCVGIMKDAIPWTLNRQWLRLLSASGSPLFVSCDPDVADEVIKKDLKESFLRNLDQQSDCEPIDWTTERLPREWKLKEGMSSFDWAKGEEHE